MQRTVEAVPEEVVRLRVNETQVATWTCSPSDLEALGAGRLLTLGYLIRPGDVRSLTVSPVGGVPTIDARVADAAFAAGEAERTHRSEHGCGLLYLMECGAERLPLRPMQRDPDLAAFPELFRELFDRSTSRRGSGGHHGAALATVGSLLHVFEEVGRHNGVDKAVGAALLDGVDLAAHGLLTTARISGEIAEKAARAGLAWVASRSVPTTLAVALAGAAGLPLVGRAASPDARVFLPGESPA
jgi:FdhD protein